MFFSEFCDITVTDLSIIKTFDLEHVLSTFISFDGLSAATLLQKARTYYNEMNTYNKLLFL